MLKPFIFFQFLIIITYTQSILPYNESPIDGNSPGLNLDQNPTNPWATCDYGYMMTGLYRGNGNLLHYLEKFHCARPTNTNGEIECQEVTLSGSSGWVDCPSGKLLKGLLRGPNTGSDDIYDIVGIRCCKFIHTQRDLALDSTTYVDSWWSSLDNDNSWADVGTNRYMTGFYRHTNGCDELSCIEEAHSKYVRTVATSTPTKNPTVIPTKNPTVLPTKYPTVNPTNIPSVYPTLFPTNIPTVFPTNNPTFTYNPTKYPTIYPTIYPSVIPTNIPSLYPSLIPSNLPTVSPVTTKAKPTDLVLGINLSKNGKANPIVIIFACIGVIVCCIIVFICLIICKKNKKMKKEIMTLTSERPGPNGHQIMSVSSMQSERAMIEMKSELQQARDMLQSQQQLIMQMQHQLMNQGPQQIRSQQYLQQHSYVQNDAKMAVNMGLQQTDTNAISGENENNDGPGNAGNEVYEGDYNNTTYNQEIFDNDVNYEMPEMEPQPQINVMNIQTQGNYNDMDDNDDEFLEELNNMQETYNE